MKQRNYGITGRLQYIRNLWMNRSRKIYIHFDRQTIRTNFSKWCLTDITENRERAVWEYIVVMCFAFFMLMANNSVGK